VKTWSHETGRLQIGRPTVLSLAHLGAEGRKLAAGLLGHGLQQDWAGGHPQLCKAIQPASSDFKKIECAALGATNGHATAKTQMRQGEHALGEGVRQQRL